MADRFQNFADLSAEMVAGVDYRIRAEDRGSAVVILAPHGGTIEPETGLIAKAIAGRDLSFYVFEALKPGAHGDFHITSHRFDEPQALALVGGAELILAVVCAVTRDVVLQQCLQGFRRQALGGYPYEISQVTPPA